MKDLKKNRLIIGMFSIAIAIIIGFVAVPAFNNVMLANTEVVRVNKNIKSGSIITDEDLELITVYEYNLPETVVKDKKQAAGKYAAVDLVPEDYILTEKISDNKSRTAEDVFQSLKNGQLAVSFKIANFASGLSGKLKNGDIISIFVNHEGESQLISELTYVRVITATTQDGIDSDDNPDSQHASITVAVNKEQAGLIVKYNENSLIHVALVYRGSNEESQKYLDMQEKLFKGGDLQ